MSTSAQRQRYGVAGAPADLAFQTRTALTRAMIAGLRERGALPFRWVTGDEHFGNTPALLDQIAGAGLAAPFLKYGVDRRARTC